MAAKKESARGRAALGDSRFLRFHVKRKTWANRADRAEREGGAGGFTWNRPGALGQIGETWEVRSVLNEKALTVEPVFP